MAVEGRLVSEDASIVCAEGERLLACSGPQQSLFMTKFDATVRTVTTYCIALEFGKGHRRFS